MFFCVFFFLVVIASAVNEKKTESKPLLWQKNKQEAEQLEDTVLCLKRRDGVSINASERKLRRTNSPGSTSDITSLALICDLSVCLLSIINDNQANLQRKTVKNAIMLLGSSRFSFCELNLLSIHSTNWEVEVTKQCRNTHYVTDHFINPSCSKPSSSSQDWSRNLDVLKVHDQ